jgi:diguanylate cyclase (GGDEF)-like protein
MSLLRRLWVSVVVAMTVVLVGAFAVSLFTARSYFEQQLTAQASDGAVSLALSMSQQSKDVATMELLVTALFDGGHYRQIRFTDPSGRVLVERIQDDTAEGVPGWLVALVPMEARPGQALVSDGWRQVGKVSVVAARSYAYRSLWRGALQLGSVMLAIGLFWAMAVSMLLRWVRRPLDEMAEQAEAIGAGQFRVIEEPRVIELQSMARALNRMSERIRALFSEQAGRIARLRDEGSHDGGTGLLNRAAFNGELRRVLSDPDVAPGGCLAVLRIADLVVLNQKLGRARTDEWLAAVAEALQDGLEAGDDVALGRLGGAEFGVLVPGMGLADGRAMLERLCSAVTALDLEVDAAHRLHLDAAAVAYRRDDTPGELMARVDSALMRAEAEGGIVAEPGGSPLPIPVPGAEGWREMLEGALARHEFTLTSYPVLTSEGGLVHREYMLRLPTGQVPVLTAGQFMPAAVRVGLAAACDLEALRLGIARLGESPEPIAINVAPRSLIETGFSRWAGYPAGNGGYWRLADCRGGQRAWAGCQSGRSGGPRRGAGTAWGPPGYRAFRTPARGFAAPVCPEAGLSQTGWQLCCQPARKPGHQRLVKAIVDVAHGLDVAVYAEQVHTAEEWAAAVPWASAA